MKLSHIRAATVILPAMFLCVAAYVMVFHLPEFFRSAPGFLTIAACFTVAATAFSMVAFRMMGRLAGEASEQNRHLVAMADIAKATMESDDINDLLSLALDRVLAVTGSDAGAVCLLDAEAEELVASCYRGLSDELAENIKRQKLGVEPIGTEAVRTGKPVMVEEIFAGPATREMFKREGFRAALSVPLKAEREVSGVLGIATRGSPRYSAAQVELLVNIATQLGLAVRNSLLHATTIERNQELSGLLAVGRAASSSLQIDELAGQALDAVVSVTAADGAELWLVNGAGRLSLACQQGLESHFRESIGVLPPGDQVTTPHEGRAASAGQDVPIRQVADGGGCYRAFPVRRGGETLGMLVVTAREPRTLSGSRFARLLEGVCEQLALAMDNASLHRRVLDVAVLEERERIARELHDGFAQVLGYISTQTMAVRHLLNSGRRDAADEQLRSMEAASRTVYGDVREAILGLSTPLPLPGSLLSSLRAYVQHFRRMAEIPAEIHADSETITAGLPASAEIQLLRIVQEALSNCRKHSNATRVDICFKSDGDELVVEIEDDGSGFDVGRTNRGGWPQFGIQSMRERALAIGGTLDIASAPQRGTRVAVRLPHAGAAQEAAVARAAG
jgi:signal transduction histidine kinase